MKANIFNNRAKLTRGFTLIELLVVISIIGMLSSVVLVSLQGARTKAKEMKFLAGLYQLKSALELYKLDNGRYPGGPLAPGQAAQDGGWHGTLATCPTVVPPHTLDEIFDANFKSRYMSSLPKELVSCGFFYLAFDNVQNSTSAVCASPGLPIIHPDGFDKATKVSDSYAYFFRVQTTNNPSTLSYPVVVWPDDPNAAVFTYTPNYNGSDRCVLGPKL